MTARLHTIVDHAWFTFRIIGDGRAIRTCDHLSTIGPGTPILDLGLPRRRHDYSPGGGIAFTFAVVLTRDGTVCIVDERALE